MWFELALAFGRTVAELQRSMSAAEFSEWAVYLSQRAAPHSPAQQTPSDMRDGFIASAQAFNTRLRRN